MKIQLASCVIVDTYDRLLLLHGGQGEFTQWELPGSLIDSEDDELIETAEAAALRGVQQELGVRVRLVKSLGNGTLEADGDEYVYHWFQAKIIDENIRLTGAYNFDDYDYIEYEDMMSLALSANVDCLLEKLSSGEVVING